MNEGGTFVGKDVCAACHQDPEHRTLGPIKGHFFPRNRWRVALAAAGAAAIVAE